MPLPPTSAAFGCGSLADYPEGRLGNCDLVEPCDGYFVLKAGEVGGAGIGASR